MPQQSDQQLNDDVRAILNGNQTPMADFRNPSGPPVNAKTVGDLKQSAVDIVNAQMNWKPTMPDANAGR